MPAPAYLTPSRLYTVLAVLTVALILTMALAMSIGSVHIDLGVALFDPAPGNVARTILLETRLPRVLMASVVGAALATAGAALQGLLRNSLAEPHLIGVSGGAAFGAVVGILVGGHSALAEVWVLPFFAALGALVSMAVVFRLGIVNGRLHPHQLLLAGVVYNAFAGALIMCATAIADSFQAHGLLLRLMGNLDNHRYELIVAMAAYTGSSVVWLSAQARSLNLLSLGEEGAMQLGVDVERLRRGVFLASSLLVGAVVSVSGMIGFVGLIVPHVLRLMFGADHRLLLPASFLGGAIFLVAADTIARTAFGVVEFPVGVVTALCGGPFFLYLLRREAGRIPG